MNLVFKILIMSSIYIGIWSCGQDKPPVGADAISDEYKQGQTKLQKAIDEANRIKKESN